VGDDEIESDAFSGRGLAGLREVQGLMVALVTASRDTQAADLTAGLYAEMLSLPKDALIALIGAFCGSFVGALETMEMLTGAPVELTIQGMGLHNWETE
jgi:hypothetical protein